ncbi:MAG: hypothetical protein OIF58_09415 [Cohaesibacter sp.]|nr:hypothetical protein [Cohaesibacter sp.]
MHLHLVFLLAMVDKVVVSVLLPSLMMASPLMLAIAAVISMLVAVILVWH